MEQLGLDDPYVSERETLTGPAPTGRRNPRCQARRAAAGGHGGMMEELITIEATAQPGKKPFRVKGLAYSGGKMQLPGWRIRSWWTCRGWRSPIPCRSWRITRTAPASRVGLVKPRLKDGLLHIEGEILSSSGVAGGIVEQAKTGPTGSSPSERTCSIRSWSRGNGLSTVKCRWGHSFM